MEQISNISLHIYGDSPFNKKALIKINRSRIDSTIEIKKIRQTRKIKTSDIIIMSMHDI